MYKLVINKEKCVNCGSCIDVCKTAEVYKFIDGKVEAVLKDKCWECGQCIAVCPKVAIEYDTVSGKMDMKKSPIRITNNGGLIENLRIRRSARVFSEKTVGRETIESLLDCTRWIPTARNQCDVEWVCIDDREVIKNLSKKTVEILKKTSQLLKNPVLKPVLRAALGNDKYKQAIGNIDSFDNLARRYEKGEDPIFHNAPVLFFTTTPSDSYFGKENSIYAGYNLMLNASQNGLSTCRIGYFDVALERDRALQDIVLGKNSHRKIQTAIILGYSKYKFCNLIDREPIKINWNKL